MAAADSHSEDQKTRQLRRDHRRHAAVWAILYWGLGWLLRAAFRLRLDPLPDPGGPRLILCNHPSMLDPMFLGLASREQFYFLSAESVFQRGLRSWLMERFLGPLVRQKGTVAAGAVIQMLRMFRLGYSVCLFPEGIATGNGRMCPLLPSTAKLVKTCKVTLVTYRLEGAYLQRPKWAACRRKGPIFGRAAGVYSPEELSALSVSQIAELLHRDLYYDDYAWQRERRIPYPCRKGQAEGLENFLYLCPGCQSVGTLRGRGETLTCDCGLRVPMDRYGFFTAPPYDSVLAWDDWQTPAFLEQLRSGACTRLEVQGATLYRVRDHKAEPLYTGSMVMDPACWTLGGYRFPLDQVKGLAVHGRNYLLFFVGEDHYEVKTLITKARYSVYPFLAMYQYYSPAAGSKASVV